MVKAFKLQPQGSPSNGTASSVEESPSGGFRESMRANLSGSSPNSDGSLMSSIFAGGAPESDAFELFDIPTNFRDFHELRRLIAKSDIPAEMVQSLMVILALAERYNSEIIPSLVGWYLVGRIGKNRMGRKEFIKASQRAAPMGEDDE